MGWSFIEPEGKINLKYIYSGSTISGLEVIGADKDVVEVVIPTDVTGIASSAFRDCINLRKLYVPDTVTSVGYNIIHGYPTLIYCSEGSYIATLDAYKNYCITFSGVYTEQAGNNLYCKFDPETRTLTFTGKGAAYSDYEMPYRLYVEHISFEDYSSTTLPLAISYSDVSRYPNLKSIKIPDGIETIGYGTFSGCTRLESIIIPDGVTSIGDYAFSGCSSLANVSLPDSLSSIGYYAFSGCSSLTDISIPNGVMNIGDYAFYGCSSLTDFEIPASITSIESGIFENCTCLTNVSIPAGVSTIGWDAFSGCEKLQEIYLPDSLTYIGRGAFNDCSSLTSITIPQGVWYLSDNTFAHCYSLKDVYIIRPDLSLSANVFDYSENVVLHCPPDSAVASFADQNGIPCNTTTIPSTTVVITEAVTNSTGTTVKWTPISGVSGYYLYRNGEKVATINGAETESYFDPEVKSSKIISYSLYRYSIAAFFELNGQICQGSMSANVYNRVLQEEDTNAGTNQEIKDPKPVAPKKPVEKITISKKPSIKKPAATKNKITVKWKHFKHTSKSGRKIWKGIKKVQIQCSSDSAYKNIVKTITVGKSKTKAVIKGLKKKTTYYVRVRYMDGTGYSKWSKSKKITTKK